MPSPQCIFRNIRTLLPFVSTCYTPSVASPYTHRPHESSCKRSRTGVNRQAPLPSAAPATRTRIMLTHKHRILLATQRNALTTLLEPFAALRKHANCLLGKTCLGWVVPVGAGVPFAPGSHKPIPCREFSNGIPGRHLLRPASLLHVPCPHMAAWTAITPLQRSVSAPIKYATSHCNGPCQPVSARASPCFSSCQHVSARVSPCRAGGGPDAGGRRRGGARPVARGRLGERGGEGAQGK